MKRFYYSLGYAINGIQWVIKSEPNMRIHLVCTCIVLFMSYFLGLNYIEWSIILLCIMSVIVLEMINTIIEKYLDFYHPERSEKVKILKDIAAGSVLLASLFSMIIGGILFMQKIISLIDC
ncbi:MAG: diacylglycerol kinase family protein [Weeksellaceae bacterium]